MKEVIMTKNAPQPGGWYSQAVKCGQFIFVSGCVAADPVSGKLVEPGNITAQTDQALKNIKAILAAAGGTLDDVVKTTVFLDDIGKFQQFNEVYQNYFPTEPPARSAVQVGKFMPGMCIEIEAVAYLK
jgi:2-iminobutanoate/2-iminopropanoate deaminase